MCSISTTAKPRAPYGKLAVDRHQPVQLSVPTAIARAPWLLGRAYEDSDVLEEFAPDSTLAVTIPTIDPHRGKLTRIVVQLPTLVQDEEGNEHPSLACRVVDRDGWPQPTP